jgi:mxaJ protein
MREERSKMTMRNVCALVGVLAVMILFSTPSFAQGTLRVCADPAYMPYSDRAGEGFENRVAQAVAGYLGEKLSYTWFSMRITPSGFHTSGGFDEFIHETLRSGKCDLVVDVPYSNQDVLTTQPYYVSSYVFVFDKTKGYDIESLDSPALRDLKIGFETETPAENGLVMRGMRLGNVPFDVGGTEGESPAVMLDALTKGRIQVAITWEPAVGYFLRNSTYSRLAVVPLPNSRQRGVPEQYIFPMAMGVRPGDSVLQKRLDAMITAHQAQLISILNGFGVKLYHPNLNPY